ncbi:tetratricopeptide repeat protein [Frigoriglobus tundricola]|uniref:FHA domain-containing protein n=1 Tax=Frigoriglobus tundricola TaxID=2774151 RepID=A0A6M5Z4J1_9BACT|nr:FHA domain-containing protein [Frigoriglobus tundricola]QJX00411.1 hypothetical protein FTUN_8041 [Frigoriglobus tundricola]
MDLHLQNVRTGDTIKLAPDRTLIGTAEHATLRTAEDGPYLAALAVSYPSGWALFGLSDDDSVMHNRRPLRAAQRVSPRIGDLLAIGDERFTFVSPQDESEAPEDAPAPACFAYIQNPDGMEECRAVDHDLLFGRLSHCHVQLADTRLSRLAALLAAHGGTWYLHTLSRKPLGRNRKAVHSYTEVKDGDELLIGPLVVRIEVRGVAAGSATPLPTRAISPAPFGRPSELPHASLASATDFAETTDDGSEPHEPAPGPDLRTLRAGAERLEQWLKSQNPSEPGALKGGLGGWLGAQRDRLRRFWYDTPETTAARSLRTSGRVDEAFVILDRAIRGRPDGPELLRELYRLYEAVGFVDLCYRPLRQIEKLADARGGPDPWVLETLARVCERAGRERPSMIDRAIGYWHKLEAATGVSYSRQRTDALALRALREGGYAGASGDAT